MEDMKDIARGVNSLLDNYVELQVNDRVLILYAPDSREPAAWVIAGLQSRGIEAQCIWMVPITDSDFPTRLARILPNPASLAGRLVVLTFERDTMSHTRVLADALRPYGPNSLTVRSISASRELFTSALLATPGELSQRNATLLSRLMGAQRLKVETQAGTSLNIDLNSDKYRWISNRGSQRPGGVIVLPAGEIATHPANINGNFVADFAFNVNTITSIDARLASSPVFVTISSGKAVSFSCDDRVVQSFLADLFSHECTANVGELGFGTNHRIVNAISQNSHINERRCGLHLGFGQHNQSLDVVSYRCPIHIDLIARGATIFVDDDAEPIDLDRIVPNSAQHPMGLKHEDVLAPEDEDRELDDCCGTVKGDGLAMVCTKPEEIPS